MGASYTNLTVKGASTDQVVRALRSRQAAVTPAILNCVVVYDAEAEQNPEVLTIVGTHLSRDLACPVLGVIVHDDDILLYQLFSDGAVIDVYDSAPGYFDPDAEPAPPDGGDAILLCSTFGVPDARSVEAILQKSGFVEDGYVFESDRHRDLVHAMGLPECSILTAYASFERGEFPKGISPEDVVLLS